MVTLLESACHKQDSGEKCGDEDASRIPSSSVDHGHWHQSCAHAQLCWVLHVAGTAPLPAMTALQHAGGRLHGSAGILGNTNISNGWEYVELKSPWEDSVNPFGMFINSTIYTLLKCWKEADDWLEWYIRKCHLHGVCSLLKGEGM